MESALEIIKIEYLFCGSLILKKTIIIWCWTQMFKNAIKNFIS